MRRMQPLVAAECGPQSPIDADSIPKMQGTHRAYGGSLCAKEMKGSSNPDVTVWGTRLYFCTHDDSNTPLEFPRCAASATCAADRLHDSCKHMCDDSFCCPIAGYSCVASAAECPCPTCATPEVVLESGASGCSAVHLKCSRSTGREASRRAANSRRPRRRPCRRHRDRHRLRSRLRRHCRRCPQIPVASRAHRNGSPRAVTTPPATRSFLPSTSRRLKSAASRR